LNQAENRKNPDQDTENEFQLCVVTPPTSAKRVSAEPTERMPARTNSAIPNLRVNGTPKYSSGESTAKKNPTGNNASASVAGTANSVPIIAMILWPTAARPTIALANATRSSGFSYTKSKKKLANRCNSSGIRIVHCERIINTPTLWVVVY